MKPADDKEPEGPIDEVVEDVAEAAEEVAEAVDEGIEDLEEAGHAMDDAVEEFAEDNPVAYRIYMWVFTLVLLIIVAYLCARYYMGQAELAP